MKKKFYFLSVVDVFCCVDSSVNPNLRCYTYICVKWTAKYHEYEDTKNT